MAGSPVVEKTQNVPLFAFADYAELLGLKGIRVDKPDQVGLAWEEALKADRPVVIDALTDPNVPTLPPHITMSQARSYAKALLKGDPEAGAITWQVMKRSVQ